MCVGATTLFAIGTALSTAQAGFQYYAQEQRADYEADLARQQEVYNQRSREQILQNRNLAIAQEQRSSSQRNQAVAEQSRKNRLAADKARATARVAAGEAGVEGASLNLLLDEYRRQELFFNSSIGLERDFANQQAQYNATTIGAQAVGQINSLRPYVPQTSGGSLFGTSLQIGSGAFNNAVNLGLFQ